jgi:AmmeMemoRadiSam system protein A
MVPMSLNKENQITLIELARESIQIGLQNSCALKIDLKKLPDELSKPRATFVTLEILEQLRGCIGMLEAKRPLAEDVVNNAFSAAFKDPRFPPLQPAELQNLDIHLAILSAPTIIDFNSEADLLKQITPGLDGLIIEENGHRGTFLPTVWETFREPQQFLDQLKLKAGLASDYWSDTLTISRYSVELIK